MRGRGVRQLDAGSSGATPKITSLGLRAPSPTEQGGAHKSAGPAQPSGKHAEQAPRPAAWSRAPGLKAWGRGRLRGGLAPIVLGGLQWSPQKAPPGLGLLWTVLTALWPGARWLPTPPPHPFTHACQMETQSSLKGNKYLTFSVPELPAP